MKGTNIITHAVCILLGCAVMSVFKSGPRHKTLEESSSVSPEIKRQLSRSLLTSVVTDDAESCLISNFHYFLTGCLKPPKKLKHVGTLNGPELDRQFGASISLDEKGDFMFIGSPGAVSDGVSDAGMVQLFKYQSQMVWNKVGDDMFGDAEEDEVGHTNQISGHSNAIAYSNNPDSTKAGYLKIIQRDNGTSGTLTGGGVGDEFGKSFSFSSNGFRLAVASKDRVKVFDHVDGSWSRVGQSLVMPVSKVALSGTGDVLAISDVDDDLERGAVKLYKWDGDSWEKMGQDILGETSYDHLGDMIDISRDGETVVVGTNGGNYVKVYEFNKPNLHWAQVGNTIHGVDADCYQGHLCHFGNAVALSDDGNGLVVGSPMYSSDGVILRGRAMVYYYGNNFGQDEWVKVDDDIVGTDENDKTGVSVAISGYGNRVAVGSSNANDYRGNVEVYEVK